MLAPFLDLCGEVASVTSFQHPASVDLDSGGKVGNAPAVFCDLFIPFCPGNATSSSFQ